MHSQVPIDPMHLIDLEIPRKMLFSIVSGRTAGHGINITKISKHLITLKPFISTKYRSH